MASLASDIRYSSRRLLNRPVFALAVVLILALGLGANTAIFAILDHVLLAKPPYPEADRVMKVYMTLPTSGGEEETLSWSFPYFRVVRDVDHGFEALAAYSLFELNLAGTEQPERLPVELVSKEYFDILGIEAEQGRVFLAEEDETPASHPVLLISHGLWQRRFGGADSVIGQVVKLDKTSFTVIGVLPRGFSGLTGNAQAWAPMMMAPELTFSRRLTRRFSHWHNVVGKLREGQTAEQAQRELRSVLERVHEQNPPPEDYEGLGASVVSLQEDRVDPALKQALFALSVAMGLVLLIACVNVISLLLVRVNRRSREAALRIALGVTRGRLVRLFLVESTFLALLGGGLGLLVAQLGIRLAGIFGPSKGPLGETASQPVAFQSVSLGTGVFAATLLLTLLIGILVGVIPALQASRVNVNSWLKEGTGGSGSRSSLRRITPLSVLVVVEIGLSLVLLIGAGLMIQSFTRLANQDLGVDPDPVLTMKISHAYRGEESESSRIFHEDLQQRLKQVPGIETVSMTNRLPLSVEGEGSNITVEGRDSEVDGEVFVGIHMVGAEHFETLDMPILRGRSFDSSHRRDTPRVAVLSETAAQKLFPQEDPVGQRIRLGIGWEDGEHAEVIGVAGDVQYGRIEDEMEPHVYIPFLQQPYPYFYLMVKSREDANVMTPLIREAVRGLNPELPIFDVKPLSDRFADYLARFRFSTFLITLFAFIAATLASVGLYGIMAYSLSGRTQELGVRKALGASSGSLFRLMLGEGFVLLLFGLGAGILLAFPLTRLLDEFLFELGGRDPLSFAGAAILLLVVGLLASLVPVLRALQVEPKQALRYE